ncbi:glutaminyl-peptide cyclotransferase-like protein [Drosophila obscura]|uniref:glutaminyl-peptide cyclotransferase-like protein n=1 Tax=Drosophila obscura TaxID=7282 RepID=UPI001BB2251F|nr:glutaminyl-peptide cyclotransferase-like protein [Drosophila obscura]
MPLSKNYVIPALLLAILHYSHGSYEEVLTVGRSGTLRYQPTELTSDQVRSFAVLSDPQNLRQTVQRIAVERVVGTPGHAAVRDYITATLKALGWHVKLDIFNGQVPILGSVTFHNIVAKLNHKARRYLMLGCHYDSKYFEQSEYVGATDAAVSCALMLNMAQVLQKQLADLRRAEISLLFVFFDGKEAVGSWSDEDSSLYGSRHLAQRIYERNQLDSIDLFVLLNHIGAKGASFYSHIPTTLGWYQRLVQMEKKLSRAGLLKAHRSYFHFIARDDPRDDHVPFLNHQVPVVHLMAKDSLQLHHKVTDVADRVDYDSTEQVALVIRLFILEYLLSASISSGSNLSAQLLPILGLAMALLSMAALCLS